MTSPTAHESEAPANKPQARLDAAGPRRHAHVQAAAAPEGPMALARSVKTRLASAPPHRNASHTTKVEINATARKAATAGTVLLAWLSNTFALGRKGPINPSRRPYRLSGGQRRPMT